MNSKPIQDFIITNERNLRIASAVSEAWPEARNQLVSGFLDRLGSTLLKKLTGWKFEPWERYFIDQFGGFYLWKPGWNEKYDVKLQCHDYGRKMIFGVGRDEKHIGERPFCGEILAAVKKHHPSARARKWWEAEIKMQTPAADWRKPEVLWRMHSDKKFLDEVAEQIHEVAIISEPIIDRLVLRK